MSGPDSPALVVGADGLIGRALADRLAGHGRSVLECSRRGDLASGARLRLDLDGDVSSWRPPQPASVAFLCAAATSLRACEEEPERTRRVNVENTLVVAETLLRDGTFVVFLSTNLVFDGSAPSRAAEDPVRPLTEYGRQKAAAERGILEFNDAAVVRLTKVLGPRDRLLVDWCERLGRNEPIEPFRDKVMAPVGLGFAADVLLRVAGARLRGITQVSARRDMSYAEAAGRLCRRLGADEGLVRPRDSSEAGLSAAASPRHTTLCTRRLSREFGLDAPDPSLALEEVSVR